MSFQTSPYEAEQPANGTAATLPPPTHLHGKPAPPQRRFTWLELPPDSGYFGFRFKAWINYPAQLQRDMQSSDEDKARAALMKIVLEHNGWVDFDGNEYPPATDPRFWDEIPNELAIATLSLVNAETGKLGISLQTIRRQR